MGAVRKKPQDLSEHTSNRKWRHVSVYLPAEVFNEIEKRSKDSRRSLSAEIVVSLEDYLKLK